MIQIIRVNIQSRFEPCCHLHSCERIFFDIIRTDVIIVYHGEFLRKVGDGHRDAKITIVYRSSIVVIPATSMMIRSYMFRLLQRVSCPL